MIKDISLELGSVIISRTNPNATMDSISSKRHNAAILIQRRWKRYAISKQMLEILHRIKSTESKIKSLEKYRLNISNIHPSNISTWKQQQYSKAARVIQKRWRQTRRTVISAKHDSNNLNSQPNREDRKIPMSVDINQIEDMILSRITEVESVNFSELDRLLNAYYKSDHEVYYAKGSENLELIDTLLLNWNEDDCTTYNVDFQIPATNSILEQHREELEWAEKPWWIKMLREPDEDCECVITKN